MSYGATPKPTCANPFGHSATNDCGGASGQLDILRHSPAEMAKAYWTAADYAMTDPNYPALAERKRRADHYTQQALLWEIKARQQLGAQQ